MIQGCVVSELWVQGLWGVWGFRVGGFQLEGFRAWLFLCVCLLFP